MQGTPSLEAADEWLNSQLDTSCEGLARTLDSLGPKVVLDHAVEALGSSDGFLRTRVATSAEREVLGSYLSRQTGIDAAWWTSFEQAGGAEDEDGLRELLRAWIGWLLAVEYVHDLARPPPRFLSWIHLA